MLNPHQAEAIFAVRQKIINGLWAWPSLSTNNVCDLGKEERGKSCLELLGRPAGKKT